MVSGPCFRTVICAVAFVASSFAQEPDVEFSYVFADDHAANAKFGFSVALSGSTMVVGAAEDDSFVKNGGAGYAFGYDEASSTWLQEAKLEVPGATSNLFAGRVVAASESFALVGANRYGTGGAAFIYRRVDGAWSLHRTLIPDDVAASDDFGEGVAIWGDTMVVGAPRAESPKSNAGAVYVYVWDGAAWNLEAKLAPASLAAHDAFGAAVAVEGDKIAVGAPYVNDGQTNTGRVYVFSRSGGVWTEEPYLKQGDPQKHAAMGESVGISGNLVIAGAPRPGNWGAAYVFAKGADGAWSQEAKLESDTYGDNFGFSVGISGNFTLVGAWRDSNVALFGGAVYTFYRELPGLWTQTAKTWQPHDDTYKDSSRDFVGKVVSIDGDRCAVSAEGFKMKGSKAGGVLLFQAPLPETTTTSVTTSSASSTSSVTTTSITTTSTSTSITSTSGTSSTSTTVTSTSESSTTTSSTTISSTSTSRTSTSHTSITSTTVTSITGTTITGSSTTTRSTATSSTTTTLTTTTVTTTTLTTTTRTTTSLTTTSLTTTTLTSTSTSSVTTVTKTETSTGTSSSTTSSISTATRTTETTSSTRTSTSESSTTLTSTTTSTRSTTTSTTSATSTSVSSTTASSTSSASSTTVSSITTTTSISSTTSSTSTTSSVSETSTTVSSSSTASTTSITGTSISSSTTSTSSSSSTSTTSITMTSTSSVSSTSVSSTSTASTTSSTETSSSRSRTSTSSTSSTSISSITTTSTTTRSSTTQTTTSMTSSLTSTTASSTTTRSTVTVSTTTLTTTSSISSSTLSSSSLSSTSSASTTSASSTSGSSTSSASSTTRTTASETSSATSTTRSSTSATSTLTLTTTTATTSTGTSSTGTSTSISSSATTSSTISSSTKTSTTTTASSTTDTTTSVSSSTSGTTVTATTRSETSTTTASTTTWSSTSGTSSTTTSSTISSSTITSTTTTASSTTDTTSSVSSSTSGTTVTATTSSETSTTTASTTTWSSTSGTSSTTTSRTTSSTASTLTATSTTVTTSSTASSVTRTSTTVSSTTITTSSTSTVSSITQTTTTATRSSTTSGTTLTTSATTTSATTTSATTTSATTTTVTTTSATTTRSTATRSSTTTGTTLTTTATTTSTITTSATTTSATTTSATTTSSTATRSSTTTGTTLTTSATTTSASTMSATTTSFTATRSSTTSSTTLTTSATTVSVTTTSVTTTSATRTATTISSTFTTTTMSSTVSTTTPFRRASTIQELLALIAKVEQKALQTLWTTGDVATIPGVHEEGTAVAAAATDTTSLLLPVPGSAEQVEVPGEVFRQMGASYVVVTQVLRVALSEIQLTDALDGDLLSVTMFDSSGAEIEAANFEQTIAMTLESVATPGSTCVFWDETQADWSTEGVGTAGTSPEWVRCTSTHLSLFGNLKAPEWGDADVLSSGGFWLGMMLGQVWIFRPACLFFWCILAAHGFGWLTLRPKVKGEWAMQVIKTAHCGKGIPRLSRLATYRGRWELRVIQQCACEVMAQWYRVSEADCRTFLKAKNPDTLLLGLAGLSPAPSFDGFWKGTFFRKVCTLFFASHPFSKLSRVTETETQAFWATAEFVAEPILSMAIFSAMLGGSMWFSGVDLGGKDPIFLWLMGASVFLGVASCVVAAAIVRVLPTIFRDNCCIRVVARLGLGGALLGSVSFLAFLNVLPGLYWFAAAAVAALWINVAMPLLTAVHLAHYSTRAFTSTPEIVPLLYEDIFAVKSWNLEPPVPVWNPDGVASPEPVWAMKTGISVRLADKDSSAGMNFAPVVCSTPATYAAKFNMKQISDASCHLPAGWEPEQELAAMEAIVLEPQPVASLPQRMPSLGHASDWDIDVSRNPSKMSSSSSSSSDSEKHEASGPRAIVPQVLAQTPGPRVTTPKKPELPKRSRTVDELDELAEDIAFSSEGTEHEWALSKPFEFPDPTDHARQPALRRGSVDSINTEVLGEPESGRNTPVHAEDIELRPEDDLDAAIGGALLVRHAKSHDSLQTLPELEIDVAPKRGSAPSSMMQSRLSPIRHSADVTDGSLGVIPTTPPSRTRSGRTAGGTDSQRSSRRGKSAW